MSLCSLLFILASLVVQYVKFKRHVHCSYRPVDRDCLGSKQSFIRKLEHFLVGAMTSVDLYLVLLVACIGAATRYCVVVT
jgi:hypothetical protein